MFDDKDKDLPEWFVKEEEFHMRIHPDVDPEVVQFYKNRYFFLFSLFVMGPSLYYVSKWSEKCQLIQNGNKFLNPKIDWRLFGNCELYSNVS